MGKKSDMFFLFYMSLLLIVTLVLIGYSLFAPKQTSSIVMEPVVNYISDPNYIEVQNVFIRQEEIAFLEGRKLYLNTYIYPENASDKTLRWSSSDRRVVTVSKDGVIYGVGEGDATITVASNNGKVATCHVTVKKSEKLLPEIKSVSLKQSQIHLYEQESIYLRYSIVPDSVVDSVAWSSSDPEVVSISEVGKITALKKGKATITIETSNHKTDTCEIEVLENPSKTIAVTSLSFDQQSASICVGDSFPIHVSILPENATQKNITWNTSDESIAKVSANGVVTGIKEGTVVVYAKTSNGVYSSCYVNVYKKMSSIVPIEGIAMQQTSATMEIDKILQLQATVLPTNATNRSISWGSSEPSVATVTNKGLVKAISPGTTIVSAFTDSGHVATTKITVLSKESTIAVVNSNDLLKQLNTSGVEMAQVSVFANGKILSSSHFNTTDSERFPISSASKSVLGIVAAKMNEDGIIGLDTPIEVYWHRANGYDYNACTSSWRSSIGSEDTLRQYTAASKKLVENPATLRNCLTHSSTIKNMSMVHMVPGDTSSEYFGGGMSKTYGRAAFMLAHTSHQLFEQGGVPGTKTSYNYLNDTLTREHALAGFTMQIAMKESINEYMAREILSPLGCSSSPYFASGNSVYFATSYYTSAMDLAKIVSAVANDGVYNNKKIFDTTTISNIEHVESSLKNQTIAFDSNNGKYIKYGIYSSINGETEYKLSDVANRYATYITYDPKTSIGFVVNVKYSSKNYKKNAYTSFDSLSKYFYSQSK